ncbi:DDB1- and CUL4-associated factor 11 isoform X1 [Cotesia glomerata]|uniref:DDB1- and CUL4-associated factor 11 n=1 Tax=Cotesia glomerata TaxID=32391 RepID=A0AAV7HVK6_COTGL|nr:DDB1- and CUL4-associated factor 11 isoform X1 [Cotesia glomerata]KAH0535208.1 hypothetical protein KQX54_014868 [Cotesia glomerata]
MMDLTSRPHMSILRTLQLLIQRGGWDRTGIDDIQRDEASATSSNALPKIAATPLSTTTLENNEINLSTKRASGFIDPEVERVNNKSVTCMIQKREIGPTFNAGQKCRINNHFLPNRMIPVAKYKSRAFCGSYSSDGKLLVTASQDNLLRIYNTQDGEFHEYKKIFAQNVSWSILDTAFSPDGNYIAYSSWSDALYLCSIYGDSTIQEALPLAPSDLGRFCVFSLVFSCDGKEILGAANDGCLYCYDRECHQPAIKIKGHTDDVNAVAFADNTSQILYSGGDDGLCKVWDRRTLNEANPHPVGVLAGHMDGITFIDPRGDGRYLLTNSKDQSIKLWDVRAFSSKEAEVNTRKAVANQDWDYRWHTHVPKQLYTSTSLLEGDTSIMTYRGHMVVQTLIRCHFSPAATTGQRYIYTGCGHGRIVIYDLLTGNIVRTLEGHEGCVRDVSWHPYHQEIISASWDGVIGCWRYSSQDSCPGTGDSEWSDSCDQNWRSPD